MKKFLCWLLAGVMLFLSGCILQGVKNPASPNPNEVPSDAPSSTPTPLTPAVLEGMSIKEIGGGILTDDGEVYYYGDVEHLWGAELYTSPVQGKEKLHRINLPEKAEHIERYCAVGESGKLYVYGLGGDYYPYLSKESVSPNGELITIDLKEEIQSIASDMGEILVLTEQGTLYCVGGLTLFGDAENYKMYYQPIAVPVPEPIEEVLLTEYAAFALGKSGQLYMAYRYNIMIYEGGRSYPEFITKDYPLPHTAQVFQPMENMSDVKDVALRKQDLTDRYATCREMVVLKKDGTVWRWNVEQEIQQAFFSGLGINDTQRYPNIEFTKMDTQGARMEEIGSSGEYVWMEDEEDNFYLLSNHQMVERKESIYYFMPGETFCKVDFFLGAEPVASWSTGLLLEKEDTLYFYGYDYTGFFVTDNSTVSLREVKGIRWAD